MWAEADTAKWAFKVSAANCQLSEDTTPEQWFILKWSRFCTAANRTNYRINMLSNSIQTTVRSRGIIQAAFSIC